MAATCTHRVITPDTGNTPNTSGSITYASGDLLVVFVTKEASALSSPMVSGDLTVANVTGVSSFTLIRVQGHRSSAAHMGVFVADQKTTGSGTTGTVTIASGADAGAGTIISVYTVAGMPAANVGANAVRQSSGQTDQAAGTPAPVFAAAALTGNACLGAIYNATNPAGMTEPGSWSAGGNSGYTTGQVSGLGTCHRNSGETGTTITWGSASASDFASIIVELATAVPGASILNLVAGFTTQGIRQVLGAATQALTASFTTAGRDAKSGRLAETYALSLTTNGTAETPTLSTSVARISLAAGSFPKNFQNHAINIRARVTSGTGTLKVALYEGATNRSGDLSQVLTTSLANYSLAIAEADAADITSYANLELRIWGESTSAVTFEVDQASLSIPEAALAGASTQTFTTSFTIAGKGTIRGSAAQAFSATFTTQGKVEAKGATTQAFTFNSTTSGKLDAKGASVLSFSLALVTQGKIDARGASTSAFVLGVTTNGTRIALGSSLSSYVLGLTTSGRVEARGAIVLPLTLGITTSGTIAGQQTGSVVLPLALSITSSGKVQARGAVVLPLITTFTTQGRLEAKGAVALPLSTTFFANGTRTTFGQTVTPFTAGFVVQGKVHAFGDVVLPLSLVIVTQGTVSGAVVGVTRFRTLMGVGE